MTSIIKNKKVKVKRNGTSMKTQRESILQSMAELMDSLRETESEESVVPELSAGNNNNSTKDIYISNLENEVETLKTTVESLQLQLESLLHSSSSGEDTEGNIVNDNNSKDIPTSLRTRRRRFKSLVKHGSAINFLKKHNVDVEEFSNEFAMINEVIEENEDEEEEEGDNKNTKDDSNKRTTLIDTNAAKTLSRKTSKKTIRGVRSKSFDSTPISGSSSTNLSLQNNGSSGTPGRKKTPFQVIVCTDEVCEMIEPENQAINTTHQDISVLKLIWKGKRKPKTVLIVKKLRDQPSEDLLIEMYKYLMDKHEIETFVEPAVHTELSKNHPNLKTYDPSESTNGTLHELIDFVISIGGDGTILWIGRIFNGPVPPVISFAMGSLGFLTPFSPLKYQAPLDKFVTNGGFLSMRTRICARIIKGSEQTKNGSKPTRSSNIENIQYHALNEAVIDRGPSSLLSNLLCYYNDKLLTRVQADGLIVGTPTGSTAYSLSAGGAIVHPAVPSMLLTPICPHTLSFRPVVLPDSATLKIKVPENSRATAWVAFDGRDRCELELGDELILWISPYPLPAVTKLGERGDWLASLTDGLQWNVRAEQKPMT